MAPPVKLPTRKLGRNGPEITAVGFGLMGLSTAYGSVGCVTQSPGLSASN
jgi:aryl-alcohol dehydrogenase-like predicted oxidoreductase